MKSARVLKAPLASLAAALFALAAWAPAAAYASQVQAVSGGAGFEGVAATRVPAGLPAGLYKYKLSQIAHAGSRTAIVAADSHRDLYEFWQASGRTTWHKQLVAKGNRFVTYSSPSIAPAGHAFVIAAVNSQGSLLYFTQSQGTWSYQIVATGRIFQAPSITVAPDGTRLISASEKSGGLYSFELTLGAPTWSTSQLVASGAFGASSVTTCYDSHVAHQLALITATLSGTLYFWWERLDEAPSWNQETIASAGPAGSYAAGSVAASSGNITVTAATSAGAVDAWSQGIGASGWTQSTVAAAGRSRYSRPEIAWTGPVGGGPTSFDVITAASKAGKLAYWWSDDGAGAWHAETIAASRGAAYAHPAISVTGKTVIVTAISTRPGDVEYWSQRYATRTWHHQLVAKG